MRLARLLAFLVLCLAPAMAQRYAGLYGRVLDTSEGGIGMASVTAVDQETGFRRTTESQPGGAYSIAGLFPGTYKITVRKEGFVSVVRFDVIAQGGRDCPRRLHPAGGQRGREHHGVRDGAAGGSRECGHGDQRREGRDRSAAAQRPGLAHAGRTGAGRHRHPRHKGRGRPVHRHRPAAQHELLHGGRRQRQHRGDRGRTAGPVDRRRAAVAERLRQHGFAHLAGCRRRISNHDLDLHRRIRPASRRDCVDHQPLRIERVSRRHFVPHPQRAVQRQRLVRQPVRVRPPAASPAGCHRERRRPDSPQPHLLFPFLRARRFGTAGSLAPAGPFAGCPRFGGLGAARAGPVSAAGGRIVRRRRGRGPGPHRPARGAAHGRRSGGSGAHLAHYRYSAATTIHPPRTGSGRWWSINSTCAPAASRSA